MANRGEDRQKISNTGQQEQWWSVRVGTRQTAMENTDA